MAGDRAGAGGRDRDGRHGQRDADRVLGRLVPGELRQHALGQASRHAGDGRYGILPSIFNALAVKTTLWTKGRQLSYDVVPRSLRRRAEEGRRPWQSIFGESIPATIASWRLRSFSRARS